MSSEVCGVLEEEEVAARVEKQGLEARITKLIRWPKYSKIWGWIFCRQKETRTLEGGANPKNERKEKQRSGGRKGKERRWLFMAAEGSSRGGGRKTSWLGMSSEGGAAKFLSGLPSRGNFSSISASSTLGRLRVYVCEHDTDPPEGQVIETNPTNILIRHLQLKKKEMDAKEAKDAKDAGSRNQGETVQWKRVAPRSLDGQNSSKRPNLGSSSGLSAAEEAAPGFSGHTLQTFTVERLRALLRQRGLMTKGKKDELIARLRESQD